MHREIQVIIALLLLLLPSTATIAQEMADSTICDSLTEEERQMPWDVRLKSAMVRYAEEAEHNYFTTGICVWDLTDDSLLFEYNQHKVMRPASIQKVVTAISALSILGAEHNFRTRALYSGTISPDSILQGDIYVVGDFDPTYSYSDLKKMAKAVRELGIKGIRGCLFGDISMKDSLLYGNGWCWDDVPSENMPYLSPLMLERGQIAPSWNRYSKEADFNPAIYFLKTLAQELKDIGGDTLRCELRTLDSRISAQTFYSKNKSVAELLPHMMKTSDNLYAEAMFFHIARVNNGRWATWKDGARLVNNVLRKADVETSYVEVADGSGVSLYNYISPKAETAMLRYAFREKNIYNILLPSLPIAGVDGSLRNRMKSGAAYKNVYAKTGSVSGVSTLAGYVMASNGHVLAFCIMNNGLMKSATGRALQDRICQTLAE